MNQTWMSIVSSRFPEGRLKNLLRRVSYWFRPRPFFRIRYNLLGDYWTVSHDGISLRFRETPFHLYVTNPLFLKHLPDWQPDLILDAGAYHGSVGLYLARRYPDALVYMLEPDPNSFAVLSDNVRLNGITNVRAISKGLWKEDGRVHFQQGHDLGSAVTRNGDAATGTIETISTATLFSGVANKKILVKMNIEGAELEVVPTLIPLWRRNRMVAVISTDHLVNGELTYIKIEALCREQELPFCTEHKSIYRETWIFPPAGVQGTDSNGKAT